MFSYREVEWFILGWISRHNYVFLGQRPRETGYRLTVELLIAKTKKKGNNQIVTLSNFSREYNMRTFWQQILFLAQEGVWVNYPQERRTFFGWGNQLSASCCFCKNKIEQAWKHAVLSIVDISKEAEAHILGLTQEVYYGLLPNLWKIAQYF